MNTAPNQTEPLLLTVQDVAKRLSVSKRTLEREIVRGRFPKPVRIGRSVRIRLADVSTYLSGLAASPQ